MFGRGINKFCCAPRRLCLCMVLTLANLSDRYSGTTLFTVLNIKDFSCFARLSARLFHLRALRIGADLASQLDPVIRFIVRAGDNTGKQQSQVTMQHCYIFRLSLQQSKQNKQTNN